MVYHSLRKGQKIMDSMRATKPCIIFPFLYPRTSPSIACHLLLISFQTSLWYDKWLAYVNLFSILSSRDGDLWMRQSLIMNQNLYRVGKGMAHANLRAQGSVRTTAKSSFTRMAWDTEHMRVLEFRIVPWNSVGLCISLSFCGWKFCPQIPSTPKKWASQSTLPKFTINDTPFTLIQWFTL